MYLNNSLFFQVSLLATLTFQVFAEAPATTSQQSSSASSQAQVIKPFPKNHGTAAYFDRFNADYFPSYTKQAYAQFKSGNYEQALSSIEAIEKAKSDKIKRIQAPEKMYLLQALCFAGTQNMVESQKSLRRALSFKASNPDLLLLKAINEAEQNNPKEALATLNEALWFGKSGTIPREEIQYTIGLVYQMTSDVQKSVDALNASMVTNAQYGTARSELAALELSRGNKPQAIKLLRESLQSQPNDFELNVQLAKALLLNADRTLNRNEITEAKRIMTEIMKQKELEKAKYLEALPVHINALLASGSVDEAEKQINVALKKDPNLPELQALKNQVQIEKNAKL